MPRGDKDAYTEKQKRQARHIEEGYVKQGLSMKTAEARAWATVNKIDGGGKKSGAGRGEAVEKNPAVKGTKKSSAAQSLAARAKAGKQAAETRKHNAEKS